MPAISVVITTHNLAGHIGQCLSDLYGQTMQDFKILIVDDCSTDETIAIAESYRDRFSGRFDVIALEHNLGLPALVRNAAIESGKLDGDYILFLDGDDRIEENMLETLYTAAVSNSADVAVCAYDRVEIDTGKVLGVEMTSFGNDVRNDLMNGDTIAFINTAQWNKLWKRDTILGLTFAPIRIGEDACFNYQAFLRSKRVVFTDKVLIHYSVRSASVISNTSQKDVWDFERVLRGFYSEAAGNSRDNAGMLVYIHIGLSMALRIADNPAIDLKGHVRETVLIFKSVYRMFKGNRLLRLLSLCGHGLKGFLIWCTLMAYRTGLLPLVLKVYKLTGITMRF